MLATDVYTVVERMNDDNSIVGITSNRYGRQLWSAGKLHAPNNCRVCRADMLTGARAWRTVNQSAMNRHHRICEPCIVKSAA